VVVVGNHFPGDVTATDLSWCGDSFPEAEVADEIHSQKTQGHVPLDGTQIVQPRASVQLQNSATAFETVQYCDNVQSDSWVQTFRENVLVLQWRPSIPRETCHNQDNKTDTNNMYVKYHCITISVNMATVRNWDSITESYLKGRLNGLVTFAWELLSKTTLLNER